jgi:elongation of very long chain fatty acids protein 6
LHWYHHATVLIYCWFSCAEFSATGRWFSAMNFAVHAVMYTYYAFRAMRFRIPKLISQIITTGQILQMIIGIYVNYTAWSIKTYSPHIPCHNSDLSRNWTQCLVLVLVLIYLELKI